MNRETIIAIAAVTLYIIWLIVFILVVERWLRRLTEMLFGITIEREISRPVGKVELLDALFLFGWKVAQPAGLGIRFAVGLSRFILWLMALMLPIAAGLAVYIYQNTRV